MAKKELYIIRHGETEYNKLNIVQGNGIDIGLNENGRRQAELFYQKYQNHPFDVVFTSSLIRTKESVAQFLASGLPHIEVPELNEISWGDFEGKPQTPDQKRIYWEMIEAWNKGELDKKINNGESPIELQLRQQKALETILNHEAEQMLICMHGRAMKSFLCLMLNKPLTAMEEFQHSNLCLYKVSYSGAEFNLQLSNSTLHLVY
ncbi:MAG: histidine phosphatase family protein [Bacteroidota bacterium]|jgi:broad specificity phosphatase PhoE